MTAENLEQKIRRIGNPVTMMRNSPQGHYEFPIPSEFSNWGDEQAAWQHTAVLFDQSFHMTDVYFRGANLKDFFSSIAVNSFATFGPDKAKQLVTVNPEGHVIGDGILFGLGKEEFSLVGRPAAPDYAAFMAETGDFDIEVTRDLRSVERNGRRLIFRYQLQGPNALAVLEKAYGSALPKIKFFNIGHFEIAGVPVRALNHTMSRHTGLEITGPSEHSAAVKEALLAAGEEFGLREGGAMSYATTPTESGWIPSPTPAVYSGDAMRPYREYLPGTSWEGMASIGGSFVSDRVEDYYQTPWDLGYGLARQVRSRLRRPRGAGAARGPAAPAEGLAAMERRGRHRHYRQQLLRRRQPGQAARRAVLGLLQPALRHRARGWAHGGAVHLQRLHGERRQLVLARDDRRSRGGRRPRGHRGLGRARSDRQADRRSAPADRDPRDDQHHVPGRLTQR